MTCATMYLAVAKGCKHTRTASAAVTTDLTSCHPVNADRDNDSEDDNDDIDNSVYGRFPKVQFGKKGPAGDLNFQMAL